MIVMDDASDGLLLVRQPDHALSSAQIARSWRRPEEIGATMWVRFLDAVRYHDDGWRDIERDPILDAAGRPHDFKSIPTAKHVEVWRCGIELAKRRDPYAALLVALHARWLYTHVEQGCVEDTRLAQVFVDCVTQSIDHLIKLIESSNDERSVVTPSNLSMGRRLMGFFDAISLAMLGVVPWIEQTEPLAFAHEHTVLQLNTKIISAGEQQVSIRPWPFESDRLEVTTIGVRLARAKFDNAQQVSALIECANPVRLRWDLMPA